MALKNKPLISIVMPVFNADKYLSESIESILSQSYPHFELIIINDGSTDRSWSIIKKYAQKDKRIRIYQNNTNLGVSKTTNFGNSQAKGQFLARMDADDISSPNRLEKQLQHLLQHPSIAAVGCQCVIMDENKKFIGIKSFPIEYEELKKNIFWSLPVQQGTLMINLKKVPKSFIWYHPNHITAEEHLPLLKLIKNHVVTNLDETLYFYRQVNSSLSHTYVKKAFNIIFQSRLQALKLGFKPTIVDIMINIIQFIVVTLLPEKLINLIWFYIRGIRKIEPNCKISVAANFEVKSS